MTVSLSTLGRLSASAFIKDFSISSSENGTQKDNPLALSSVDLEEQLKEFNTFYPIITKELLATTRNVNVPELTKRYSELLDYVLFPGGSFRSLLMVITYKALEKPENLTPENIKLANILAWCVKLVEVGDLTMDDAFDNAELRHGTPCWYKTEQGSKLFNMDAMTLEFGAFTIMKKYFSSHPYYVDMLEKIIDVHYKTGLGETADVMTTFDQFTDRHFAMLAEYKNGYYTISMPVIFGMYLSKTVDEEVLRLSAAILLEMGKFFQIHDDYIDAFGDGEEAGKDLGRDIREGRCNWLAVVALQRVDSNQRKTLEENYGKPDETSVNAVRHLYGALKLDEYFTAVAKESYEKTSAKINQIPNESLKGLLHWLARRIYLNESYEIY